MAVALTTALLRTVIVALLPRLIAFISPTATLAPDCTSTLEPAGAAGPAPIVLVQGLGAVALHVVAIPTVTHAASAGAADMLTLMAASKKDISVVALRGRVSEDFDDGEHDSEMTLLLS
ncbi:hypothetical protein [Bradyrhizobium sp. ORS 86]|uniref:hypothetical protein n=1 Tax=Bradyrhizobium sp. ORS 86 TaxID=1685970 RepID=UPI00388FE727